MKRVLSFALVLIIAMGLLSACGSDEAASSNSIGGDSTAANGIFSTADVQFVGSDGGSVYSIIRPEGSDSACSSFVFKQLKQKLNVSAKNSSDTEDGADKYEILVGYTNRPESAKAKDYLVQNVGGRVNDYIICTIGKKIVILGMSDDATMLACEQFAKDYIKADGIKGGIKVTVASTGDFENITVNNTSIGKFKFVRPHFNSSYLAQLEMEKLTDTILKATGFMLPIVEDDYVTEGDLEINFGLTNRSGVTAIADYDKYEVKISGNKVYINGGTVHATALAISEFSKLLTSKKTLTDADSFSGSYAKTIQSYDYATTWRPVFGDEFDGDEVDTSKWKVQPKTANGREGQNGKFSGMDPNAVFVREGMLTIAAHEDDEGYWGGEIVTEDTMNYKFGYIEFSCITPDGDGFWSLLWLTRGKVEPGYATPEIDVNECFGNAKITSSCAHSWPSAAAETEKGWLHEYKAQKLYCLDEKHFGEDFHTFGFLWDENEMKFTADGKVHFTYTNTTEQDIDSFVKDEMMVRIGMSMGRKNNSLLVENLTEYERYNTNKFIVDWVHLYQMDDPKYIFRLFD